MPDLFYGTSPIKRHRATDAEVVARRQQLFNIVANMKPMTVRQVFYQASVRGIVDKSECGYRKVQGDLTAMRKGKTMPYGWLADSTRFQRKPTTYSGIQEALGETARLYRKRLWMNIPAYVEIWIEKDALSGVVFPITSRYDVPLMVARGYASLTFLHGAAEYISELDVPAYIYHFGDYDPSGVNAGEVIEKTLREMAPGAKIHFERRAVTPEQIASWNLPMRPTKGSDSRAKRFGDVSVELDAIEPDKLRDLVETAILGHISKRELAVVQAAEESERSLMKEIADNADYFIGIDC